MAIDQAEAAARQHQGIIDRVQKNMVSASWRAARHALIERRRDNDEPVLVKQILGIGARMLERSGSPESLPGLFAVSIDPIWPRRARFGCSTSCAR
jgi:hypothetical protein